MTLVELVAIMRAEALSMPNINGVYDAFNDLNIPDARYSSIILQQDQHRVSDGFISYGFYIGYVDRVSDSGDDELFVQSHAIEVLYEYIAGLERSLVDADISMGSITVFVQRFLADAAGAYSLVSIDMPKSVCDSPGGALSTVRLTIDSDGHYELDPEQYNCLGFRRVEIDVYRDADVGGEVAFDG